MTNSTPSPALNPDDFWTYSELAKHLPHLKVRATSDLLEGAYHHMLLSEVDEALIGTETVTLAQLQEVFHSTLRTGFQTRVISPAGARLIRSLYEKACLPLAPRQMPQTPSEAFVRYCDSEHDLAQKQAQRLVQLTAYQDRVAHPERVSEAEFTFQLLSDIFWKHLGKGVGQLTVGGIPVTKSLDPRRSNSGKNIDFGVRFSWIASDGQERNLEKPSRYAANRRNDADRNWGLPD